MSFLVVIMIVAVVLFFIPFSTKRRFGTLALALAAGSILSQMWSPEITRIVRSTGIELVAPPLQSVITVILILLPAILVVRSGLAYHSRIAWVATSILFSLLGISFLLKTLASVLVIDGAGRTLYTNLLRYNGTIITLGITVALIDIILTKTHKKPRDSGKH
jgi:hypothetical protein